jgi:ATP-dependent Clp protease ATP-binding subunit ClpX
MDRDETEYRCSFCNKHQSQVHRLFAGPGGVYICEECVRLGSEILTEEHKAAAPRPKGPLRPWQRRWRR